VRDLQRRPRPVPAHRESPPGLAQRRGKRRLGPDLSLERQNGCCRGRSSPDTAFCDITPVNASFGRKVSSGHRARLRKCGPFTARGRLGLAERVASRVLLARPAPSWRACRRDRGAARRRVRFRDRPPRRRRRSRAGPRDARLAFLPSARLRRPRRIRRSHGRECRRDRRGALASCRSSPTAAFREGLPQSSLALRPYFACRAASAVPSASSGAL